MKCMSHAKAQRPPRKRILFLCAILVSALSSLARAQTTYTLTGATNWTALAPSSTGTIYLNGYTLTCNTASATIGSVIASTSGGAVTGGSIALSASPTNLTVGTALKSGTSAALLTLSSGTLLNLTLSGGTASPAGNDPLCIVQGGTLAVAGGLITGGAASGSYHGVHVNSGLFTSSGTVQAGTGSTNAYGLYQTGGSTNIAYMNGWKSPNYISGGTTTIGTIAGGVGSGGYGLELSGSAVINATNVGGGTASSCSGIYVVSGGTINATNVWGGSGACGGITIAGGSPVINVTNAWAAQAAMTASWTAAPAPATSSTPRAARPPTSDTDTKATAARS